MNYQELAKRINNALMVSYGLETDEKLLVESLKNDLQDNIIDPSEEELENFVESELPEDTELGKKLLSTWDVVKEAF